MERKGTGASKQGREKGEGETERVERGGGRE